MNELFRLDQPMHMCSSNRASQNTDLASNGSCSEP